MKKYKVGQTYRYTTTRADVVFTISKLSDRYIYVKDITFNMYTGGLYTWQNYIVGIEKSFTIGSAVDDGCYLYNRDQNLI